MLNRPRFVSTESKSPTSRTDKSNTTACANVNAPVTTVFCASGVSGTFTGLPPSTGVRSSVPDFSGRLLATRNATRVPSGSDWASSDNFPVRAGLPVYSGNVSVTSTSVICGVKRMPAENFRLRAVPSVTKYSVGARKLTSVWKNDLSGARNITARVSFVPDFATSQSFSTGIPRVTARTSTCPP